MSKLSNWWKNVFKPWWIDKVSDNFRIETRDSNEGLGRFLNGVDNLWNRVTGAGLTGAEIEANRFSSLEAEKAFDREVEFYEKYSSPKAQINSQIEAGVNPFGLSGTSSGPVASSSSPSSVSPTGGTDMFGLVQTLLNFSLHKKEVDSSIALNRSVEAKNYAEAENTSKNTSWIDRLNTLKLDEMQSAIDNNRQSVNESIQRVQESISRVKVNDSTIELNGAQILLNGTQSELNKTKSICYELDAQKASLLMPYIQARQEAEIAFTTAQTEEARHSAEKAMYDANVSMLKGMVESDLISQGYYDNLVNKSEFEYKNEKRDYKWKPVNDICSNVSKIAVGVGSVVSGFSGMASGASSVASVASSPATLAFF